MRDKDIIQGLSNAIQDSTPDVLVNILSSCNHRPEKQRDSAPSGAPITLTALPRKRKTGMKPFLAAAAALILIVSGFLIYDNAASDTVIELDVNPSIALNTTRKGKVLSATAGNTEGEQVLKDMKLKGSDLNVAMNALLGSMIRNGFVTEAKNSILVSIENRNDKRSAELKARLLGNVYAAMEENSIHGAVLCQVVANDNRLKALAKENGVSLGKAALVDILVQQDSTLDFAELCKLSINDLSLLIENKDAAPQEMAVSGKASKEVYISESAVKEIVLDHANITAAAVGDNYRCKLDWDDGRMVYEVDFFTESTEYDYELDALTGKIINFKSAANDNRIPSNNGAQMQGSSGSTKVSSSADGSEAIKYIGSAKAKEIALKHAGVSAADANWLRVELERDDGNWEYQVEFWVGNVEYDYEIDAVTGKILEHDHDIENYTPNKETTTKVPVGDKIGEAKAKEIAFTHAKVAAGDATHLKVKLARDDGRWEYQIEFWVGNVEYDYEIDAYSGKILDWDRDVEYKAPGSTNSTTAPLSTTAQPIGEARAKEIAFAHAGVAAADARKLEVETDREGGKLIYQIEFKAGNMEYDYEIDAHSGKILHWDKERAD